MVLRSWSLSGSFMIVLLPVAWLHCDSYRLDSDEVSALDVRGLPRLCRLQLRWVHTCSASNQACKAPSLCHMDHYHDLADSTPNNHKQLCQLAFYDTVFYRILDRFHTPSQLSQPFIPPSHKRNRRRIEF